ncbi:type II toxin-antitoxin system HicB family antitoxin [Treponema parvum]|uniref:Type II toxin-antitoxin system HicB family antitoxin n=1 Tax=Treponema parvum TaxID=138851 RepID=A0A975EZR6_9SPIR|nr:type II toxin-antitoxin system HicB family antitoxin [Treponema parvum]QTQ11921.1 type II toxin-antitoxin system HicB family antitoxin [Treponema parvum]QTQ16103.1 type II toxin-antitoxin system HicB family antitoxin [Treponema parvum]
MKVIYPAIFHGEDGGFWVEFPDLPGCTTQGDSQAETYINAVEAMELFLQDDYTVDTLPAASAANKIKPGKDSFVVFVCGEYKENEKAVKKTLTIPFWLNVQAEKAGVNFSQTLQEALCKKLNVVM